ncbi:hypothetical protein NKG05_12305 [Oerskovia sp. M15]
MIDGDLATYWSPSGSTGSIGVKWGSATSVSKLVVREAAGGGTLGAWRVVNNDTGAVLKTGSGRGPSRSRRPRSRRSSSRSPARQGRRGLRSSRPTPGSRVVSDS